jgi:hypothetical protein
MTELQHFAFVELPTWVMIGGVAFTAVMIALISWLEGKPPPKAGE